MLIDDRYNYVMQVIYEKIRNMVVIKKDPKAIATEIANECRLELRIPDVPKDMLLEFYRSLAEMCWYSIYQNYEYDPITKPRSKSWNKNN